MKAKPLGARHRHTEGCCCNIFLYWASALIQYTMSEPRSSHDSTSPTMKQRITYLVQDPDVFSPEQLDVKGGSLTLDKVNAAKEHRVTFGLSELPREVC